MEKLYTTEGEEVKKKSIKSLTETPEKKIILLKMRTSILTQILAKKMCPLILQEKVGQLAKKINDPKLLKAENKNKPYRQFQCVLCLFSKEECEKLHTENRIMDEARKKIKFVI